MVWRDDEDLVDSIEPPPDQPPGWKIDSHYGGPAALLARRGMGCRAAPAPGNLDIYKQLAAGEAVDEDPAVPPIPFIKERSIEADE